MYWRKIKTRTRRVFYWYNFNNQSANDLFAASIATPRLIGALTRPSASSSAVRQQHKESSTPEKDKESDETSRHE